METRFKTDPKLQKEIAALYGDIFHLPPLAARINAFLIFDFDREGVTFEELVEIFAASKSSVSASINLLLSMHLITDITKCDQRKRFFITNDGFVKIRLEDVAEKMEKEIEILNSLRKIRPNLDEESERRFITYKAFLSNNIDNINDYLSKV